MDDRWQKRAAAKQKAQERYEWKRAAIDRLLAEAEAELDAAVAEANAMIPKAAPPKPRDRMAEKAARILVTRETRRSAQG